MNTKNIQQLDFLVATIDDLLDDSTVAGWHSALLNEAKNSFRRIQQQAATAVQENLTGVMI